MRSKASALSMGLATLLACASAASAQVESHWPNWRGPLFTGAADATNLPAQWDPSRDNLWTAPLPGPGSATPVVWDQHIFLMAADKDSGELLTLCLSAVDGRTLWSHAHGPNRRQGRNDLTAPSPVTNGQQVIFLLGSGRLVAYDLAGRELWRRELAQELGVMSWQFGYGASPLLFEGRLYMQFMRRPTHRQAPADSPLESYLLAIDPATGQDLWKQVRPAQAAGESNESYITPLPLGRGETAQLVLAGADALTGHDAASGRELWRYTFNEERRSNWRLVPTPVSDGRRVFVALPRGSSLVAVEPGQPAGPISGRALWSLTDNAPDVCSPLYFEGRLYVLDGDRKVMTCLDAQSGRVIWRGQLEQAAIIRSSPTAADGKVFCIDEAGRLFVLAAGDRFQVLAQMDLGSDQPTRSSVVIAGNRLYIRTTGALHCLGTPAAPSPPSPDR